MRRLSVKIQILPLVVLILLVSWGAGASAFSAEAGRKPYEGWAHSGSIFILTTPEGANLPAEAAVENFPLLVRLRDDSLRFNQAQGKGEDFRVATSDGAPLPYQIELWDPKRGEADVWIRVPKIYGNARQELRLFWGRADAKSESSGAAVFGESNGYLSVWHLHDAPQDDVGTLSSQDVGTISTMGVIGQGRHFAGGQGIFCGDKISNYPSGASEHSTEAWFRAERPNSTIIGWGNEGGGRGSKVRMLFRSPPHIKIDSDFADVSSPAQLSLGQWIHVVHTYSDSDARIYINGQLSGRDTPKLNIKSPARAWLGGWYHNYSFVGDLDEVRVSKVARSANWVRLQYENQKPLQTLVGPVVQPGEAFVVSSAALTVREGQSTQIMAQAGGAQKLYWMVKRAGEHRIVAVDRRSYMFHAGRVDGDETATLELRAVYPNEVKSKDIVLTIREAIADPEVSLQSPLQWDGRKTIELVPQIANATKFGPEELRYRWTFAGPAVINQTIGGKLVLHRALGSGPLKVTLRVDNGGTIVERSATIAVAEPSHDAWVERTPNANEQPREGQFYARDDRGVGTLIYNGALEEPAESVFLRLFADDKLIANQLQKVGGDKRYAFAIPLKPGLIRYRVEFGTGQRVLRTVSDLVCGDAFLIVGQSNAVATDFGKDAPPPPINPWVRTFGAMDGNPRDARALHWAPAVARSQGGIAAIGYWGMELGRRLVESRGVPVCFINGAVGGTRIDQHQRNTADPADLGTIYGRLLWRVRAAGLTHGVRGVLWHQGENDQAADGPTGGFGWETYREYFHDLAAGWQQDYPNLQHIHLFQIWPRSCAMGFNGSDNHLREVQRTLPQGFSKLSIMSTLGVRPPGGCHFPAAGYAEFARLIEPLVLRNHYGQTFDEPISPPNLLRANYVSAACDEIVLQFDQPVVWHEKLASEFYLDGASGNVRNGSAEGNRLLLRLNKPSTATKISYLDSKSWSQDRLLMGANGIAALTFWEVPIAAADK